jgi:uncharacterized protein
MPPGFHEGELAVQARADVLDDASRLSGMLDTPQLRGGLARFLADRDFAVLTARDAAGTLWISPLLSEPGFLDASGGELRIHARPRAGDPLAELPADQPVGLVVMDFVARRRVRINGRLTESAPQELRIAVEQAYGNCPQYIQQRHIHHVRTSGTNDALPEASHTGLPLTTDHQELIHRSDTFFLGTIHPDRGADASHRGGLPGFARSTDQDLWWPDYPGNNMFNSLGNLVVDDEAALLFLDFDRARALHLSGTATIEWIDPDSPGDDGHTGRRVRFQPSEIAEGPRLDLIADAARFSPYDPPLT